MFKRNQSSTNVFTREMITEDPNTLRVRVAEAEQRLKILEAEHEKLEKHTKSMANVEKQVETKKKRIEEMKEKIHALETQRDEAKAKNAELEPTAEAAIADSKSKVKELSDAVFEKEKMVSNLDKENELLYAYVDRQAQAIKLLNEQLRKADIEPGIKTDGELLYLSEEIRKRPGAKAAMMSRTQSDNPGSAFSARNRFGAESNTTSTTRSVNASGNANAVSGSEEAAAVCGGGSVRNLFSMFEGGGGQEREVKSEYNREAMFGKSGSSKKNVFEDRDDGEKKTDKREYSREDVYGTKGSGKNLFAMFESGEVAEQSAKEHEAKFKDKEFDHAALDRRLTKSGSHNKNPLAVE